MSKTKKVIYNGQMTEYMDVTPTWEQILPSMFMCYENFIQIKKPTADQVASLLAVKKEFGRMAAIADKWTAHTKAEIEKSGNLFGQEIETENDVHLFLSWCIIDQNNMGFHPDSGFGDYAMMNNDDPKYAARDHQMYSEAEVDVLDRLLGDCFAICGRLKLDIYAIAQEYMDHRDDQNPIELKEEFRPKE